MKVYSVSFKRGRSMVTKRKWFSTAVAADVWYVTNLDSIRDACGPLTHDVNGIRGLTSILNTYAGDGA